MRKLMTMHKALHLKDDVDSLYMTSKEGKRGCTCIDEFVDTVTQELEEYKNKSKKKN